METVQIVSCWYGSRRRATFAGIHIEMRTGIKGVCRQREGRLSRSPASGRQASGRRKSPSGWEIGRASVYRVLSGAVTSGCVMSISTPMPRWLICPAHRMVSRKDRSFAARVLAGLDRVRQQDKLGVGGVISARNLAT